MKTEGMNRVKLLLVAVTGFFTGIACGQENKISVDRFEKNLQNSNVQLLDVRSTAEYKSGHIPHTLQADWRNKEEFTERTGYLDKNKPVYVYCASGVRSEAAAVWLRKNGFRQVMELNGGLNAWKQQNKPVTIPDAVTRLSYSEYTAALDKKDKVLVVFCSEYLPLCTKNAAALKQLKATVTGKFEVIQYDAETGAQVMQQLQVTGKPAYILYRQGKETWRKQGPATVEELKKVMEK